MTLDEIKQKALIRIVDDDEELADALQFFLGLDGWQCVVYRRALDFLTQDFASRPGCVVLDVKMPGLSGLECQRLIREHQLQLPVLFMSGHGDIDMAVQTVLDGAVDFIQKPVDEQRLIRGVVKAATQSVERSEGIVSDEEAHRRVDSLTARERQIAALVAQGLVSRQIALRLGIAQRTVEVQRSTALKKLGVREPLALRRMLRAAESAAPGL